MLLFVESSAVELAMLIFQVLSDTIDLRIITCKSKLLTEAERRTPSTSREADAVSDGIDLGEPYLMQSTAKAYYIFSDMASIQFVSRNRAFSNFLLELSMKISKFPNLNAVAVPRRVLFLPIFFRGNVIMLNLKEKAQIFPKNKVQFFLL